MTDPAPHPDERIATYQVAAERLADAAEDVLFAIDTDGELLQELRAAWQHYVEVADARPDFGDKT